MVTVRAGEREASIKCGFRVGAAKTAQIDEPNVVQRAEGRAREVHAGARGSPWTHDFQHGQV